MALSAINNSSVSEGMTLEEILHAADERLATMNRNAHTPIGAVREEDERSWRRLVETARAALPEAIRPFVRADRSTNRDEDPNRIALSIDLPDCERIHFGPWVFDEKTGKYEVAASWRNTPFMVGGGSREEFGDLLDAIARAREVYRMNFEQNPPLLS